MLAGGASERRRVDDSASQPTSSSSSSSSNTLPPTSAFPASSPSPTSYPPPPSVSSSDAAYERLLARKRHLLQQLDKHQQIIEEYEKHHIPSPGLALVASSPSNTSTRLPESTCSDKAADQVGRRPSATSQHPTTSATLTTSHQQPTSPTLTTSHNQPNSPPCLSTTIPQAQALELQRHEYEWYDRQYASMQRLLKELHYCRLEGGRFAVYPTKRLTFRRDLQLCARNKMDPARRRCLDVSAFGRMTLWIVPHLHVERVRHIDELQCVRMRSHHPTVIEVDQRGKERVHPAYNLVRMDWIDGQSSLLVCDDAAELVEVVGAHLRHFNHKKIQHILHLKRDLYALKSRQILATPQSDADRESQRLGLQLLMRLWQALNPSRPFLDDWNGDVDCLTNQQIAKILRDDRWKWLGFQSATPASDLRGMGLLGLWFLVFLAERASGAAIPMLTGSATKPNKLSIVKQQLERKAHSNHHHVMKPLSWIIDMVHFHAEGGAEACKSNGRKIPSRVHHHDREYPWAVAGINIASMLIHRLLGLTDDLVQLPPSDPRWNSPLLSFLCYLEPSTEYHPQKAKSSSASLPCSSTSNQSSSTADSPPDHLRKVSSLSALSTQADIKNKSDPLRHAPCVHANVELVFEVAMELVERIYRRTGAGYMDFPVVLRRVESKLEEWLCGGSNAETSCKDVRSPIRSLASAQETSAKESPSLVQRLRRSGPSVDRSYGENRPISMEDLWQRLFEEFPVKAST